MGLPPPSPSPDANSTALPSEGGPWLQRRPLATQKREIGTAITPGPATPHKGERILGDTPDPRYGATAPFTLARRHSTPPTTTGIGLPPPSPSPDTNSTALPSEGGPWLQRRPLTPRKRETPFDCSSQRGWPRGLQQSPLTPRKREIGDAMTPDPATPRREKGISGAPTRPPVWGCRPLHPRQTPIRPKPKGGGQRPPPRFAFR
jgi:hypothetical protein